MSVLGLTTIITFYLFILSPQINLSESVVISRNVLLKDYHIFVEKKAIEKKDTSSNMITVYISSTGNLKIMKEQRNIEIIFASKKIPATYIDVATDEVAKNKMRELMGNERGLAPQIFNGQTHCGGYEDFEDAIESEELESFLNLK